MSPDVPVSGIKWAKPERVHFEEWMIRDVHPRCQQKGMHSIGATLWEQRPKLPASVEASATDRISLSFVGKNLCAETQ